MSRTMRIMEVLGGIPTTTLEPLASSLGIGRLGLNHYTQQEECGDNREFRMDVLNVGRDVLHAQGKTERSIIY
jgi:hypothetical protein